MSDKQTVDLNAEIQNLKWRTDRLLEGFSKLADSYKKFVTLQNKVNGLSDERLSKVVDSVTSILELVNGPYEKVPNLKIHGVV